MRITGVSPQTSPGINAFENGNANDSVQDRIGFRRVRFGVAGDVCLDTLEF